MINEVLSKGAKVTAFTSDGQLSGTLLETNSVGVLITTSVPRHGGETEEQTRFYPWTQIRFIVV